MLRVFFLRGELRCQCRVTEGLPPHTKSQLVVGPRKPSPHPGQQKKWRISPERHIAVGNIGTPVMQAIRQGQRHRLQYARVHLQTTVPQVAEEQTERSLCGNQQ